MTKTEMLDKIDRIRGAVAALPDNAIPIAASVSGSSEYIQLSSCGKTMEATIVVKEHRAKVLGVPVIWLEV